MDAAEVEVPKPPPAEIQTKPPADVVSPLPESSASTADPAGEMWKKLQNLKNLLNAGYLSKTEYKERKAQLVDEMTGTTISTHTQTQTHTRRRHKEANKHIPEVVPKPPPDFRQIPSERAMKYIYDLETQQWRTQKVKIKLDPTPFSKGALRLVYHMQDLSAAKEEKANGAGGALSYVAKISMDPRDNVGREVYFRDVEMQCRAKHYAEKFNSYNPPKQVGFVKAWIYELLDRKGRPICGVEKFIDGPYRKHNNNFGYVSEEERNTPQAFSHFTFEVSDKQLVVVDIQGVGDLYTDPQIHSADGLGFGKGNLGKRGIERFLKTHSCNAICRYLKLPPINANYAAIGTLPVTQFMPQGGVAVAPPGPATSSTPLLAPLTGMQDDQTCKWCCVV